MAVSYLVLIWTTKLIYRDSKRIFSSNRCKSIVTKQGIQTLLNVLFIYLFYVFFFVLFCSIFSRSFRKEKWDNMLLVAIYLFIFSSVVASLKCRLKNYYVTHILNVVEIVFYLFEANLEKFRMLTECVSFDIIHNILLSWPIPTQSKKKPCTIRQKQPLPIDA